MNGFYITVYWVLNISNTVLGMSWDF